jgi:Tol biopolymer transport system component
LHVAFRIKVILALLISILVTATAVSPIFLLPKPTQQQQQQQQTTIASGALTTGPESHLDPDYSSTGTQIAFSQNTSGYFQIWTMTSSGNELVQLTSFASNQRYPKWNPSGNEIAFLSIVKSGSTIMVLNILTKKITKMCPNSCSNESTYAWSPSGSNFVFNSLVNGKSEIFLADTSTWKVLQLTPANQAENLYPSWCMDNQCILFSSNSTGRFAIYQMNTQGGEVHQLSQGTGNDFVPIMSPNGEYISFTSNDTGQMSLWIMDSNGSWHTPVQSNPLKQKPGLAFSPLVCEETFAAWRPDGKELLYDTAGSQLMAFYIGVMVVNYNGAGRGTVQLGNSLVSASINQSVGVDPSWRPDGGGIIYASNQTGSFEIYAQILNFTSPNPYG